MVVKIKTIKAGNSQISHSSQIGESQSGAYEALLFDARYKTGSHAENRDHYNRHECNSYPEKIVYGASYWSRWFKIRKIVKLAAVKT
jgi:hypothetical protein